MNSKFQWMEECTMTQTRYISILLITVCLCAFLSGCNRGSTFNGNRVTNEDSFQMDYSILNQCEKSSLTLAEGEVLQVVISHQTGSVDVAIGMDDLEAIYEGNNLANISFSLGISETGTYQIAVTGHNACGSVVFTKMRTK